MRFAGKVLLATAAAGLLLLSLLAAVAQDWAVVAGCLGLLAAAVLAARAERGVRGWVGGDERRRGLVLGTTSTLLGVAFVTAVLAGWRPEGRALVMWATGPLCLLLGVPIAAGSAASGRGRRAGSRRHRSSRT